MSARNALDKLQEASYMLEGVDADLDDVLAVLYTAVTKFTLLANEEAVQSVTAFRQQSMHDEASFRAERDAVRQSLNQLRNQA